MNGVQKYVVTHRPVAEPVWTNTTVITGEDVAGQLQLVKDSTSGKIGMSGSATLVRWLLSEGLLDELTLLIHPVAVGKGERLFDEMHAPLKLVHDEALPSGVLHVRYEPA